MDVLATTLDPDGRRVDLLAERWAHIVGDQAARAGHPELQPHRPEGHAVRFDADGRLIGITIVNARKLVDKDGGIRITVPETISAADIGPALVEA
jgi:hypothetical protein